MFRVWGFSQNNLTYLIQNMIDPSGDSNSPFYFGTDISNILFLYDFSFYV